VLARLAKGGLVGAGLGGAGGAMAGPVANDALSQLITNDNTPLHTGVAQSLTVSDLISGAAGQDLSPQRRMGLGVEGLIRGGDEMIDSFFPR
jgi:hypothetical protein